ncbi:MAG: T9SS type A sorting domain-containing protein [Paludibacteraceae bacterium]|nr:T9SS type A sorting domain-containing protein [Paludibacteraceae bacterium]
MKKIFTLVSSLLMVCGAVSAQEYVPNGFFEENVDGWALWNGGDDGCSFKRNSGTHFDGQGCLEIVSTISEPTNQWKVQLHTDFTKTLPAGEYELSYYIRTLSGTGSVRVSTSGDDTFYQADQTVTSGYTKKTMSIKSTGACTGFNFDLGAVANTYYIDNVSIKVLSQEAIVPEEKEVAVEVEPNSKNQTVEGIGGGIVYYQGWIPPHENSAAIYDTIFNGLGISALRLGNWLQDLNDKTSEDEATVKEANKRLGRENYIIEMSSWAAPGELKSNGDINGGYPLKKENGKFVYDKYADWWKTSLKKYMDAGIVPDYISMQNEPDMAATYAATMFDPKEKYVDYTGKQFDNSGYAEALPVFCKAIRSLDNAPKILGPEVLGIGYNNTENYMKELDKSLLDGLAFHYYHSGQNASDRYSAPDAYIKAMSALASEFGDMPQFMTENCSMRSEMNGDDVSTAWILANAFNYNRVNGYFHWNLMWGDADGCVTVFNPWDKSNWKNKEGYTINKEYHGLRHFSKFVKKGYVCTDFTVSSKDIVTASFISPDKKKMAVILINKGESEHEVTVSVKDLNVASAHLHQTIDAEGVNSKDMGEFNINDAVVMPKMSIATLEINLGNPSCLVNTKASSIVSANISDGNLNIVMEDDKNANIELWDVTGVSRFFSNANLSKGINSFTVSNLNKGIYFVKVGNDVIRVKY